VIVVGAHWQVGNEKFNTFGPPPAYITVNWKLIIVPHTKAGDVLTENGTVFVEVAFSGVFG
jgi:hypothetical protein